MIYVFRSRASTGARQLAEALDGRRIRQEANLVRMVRPGDTVVCWGEAFQAPGVTVLNGGPIRSKLADAETLRAAGIRTIEASRTRPQVNQAAPPDPFLVNAMDIRAGIDDFIAAEWRRHPVFLESVDHLVRRLTALREMAGVPAPVAIAGPAPDWFPRVNNHMGGLDLLTPPATPDYWVKREAITEEYRIHCFDGRSVRAGVKRPRQGQTPHQWIRSYDGGWRIVYDRYESTQGQRQLAAAAVEALGLIFGAVDLGLLADGALIILEVNRAPGLEGGTIESYARAIERWEEGQERRAA